MNDTDKFYRMIDNHSRVKWLRRQIADGQFTVNFKNTRNEMDDIHRRRLLPNMTGKTVEDENYVARLLRAQREEMAARSRLVSMRVSLYRKQERLQMYVKKLKIMLGVVYAPELRKLFSSIGDRQNALSYALEDADSMIYDMDVLANELLIIIEDIDKLSWSNTSHVETLKISVNRDRY